METLADFDVKTSVRKFITKSIGIGDIRDDEDLFDSGIVNSLFSIQLVTFIEKSFGLEITQDDLDMDNFKSVDAVCNFVRRKQGK
ncbi:acyl carrier protein [Chryseolinea lacunae]|uniref:Carrier domain-containing protein n=1 Tax=Chryseolinea lacunae TaxID=2801331 RepID=A0ABS1KUL0_9BACT|nr:phosphopantetheine-binding protein [Chryseolinea lacunae]MBL0743059.1 hypothetical protein [Chryseolinea lacunae]